MAGPWIRRGDGKTYVRSLSTAEFEYFLRTKELPKMYGVPDDKPETTEDAHDYTPWNI